MRICPACGFQNLPGDDECSECGVSLTLEDTNPEYKQGKVAKYVTNPIGSVPLRNAVIASPTTSVSKVIQDMNDEHMGGALVVENNEVIGIFTERDVLKRYNNPDMDLSDIEVQNMMTPSPEVLDEDDSIAFAIHKMSMGNFRHVPIKKKDGTFTFFAIKDAVRYLF